MKTKTVRGATLLLTICVILASVPLAEANLWTVVAWAGRYLLGKGVDAIWDTASGKPDVRELDSRLQAIENALSDSDARMAATIRGLRDRVHSGTTKEEYYEMAVEALTDLSRRVTKLEGRVTLNEAAIRDLNARMERVERRFGISAEPTYRTSEGRLRAVKNALDQVKVELLEVEVKLLLRNDQHARVVAKVTEVLEGLDKWDLSILEDADMLENIDWDKARLVGMTYELRGKAYSDLGIYDMAISDYTRAIRLISTKEDIARLYFSRGAQHEQKGAHEAAESDYRRAAELFPGKDIPGQNLDPIIDRSRSTRVSAKCGEVFVVNNTNETVRFRLRYYIDSAGQEVKDDGTWSFDPEERGYLVKGDGRRIVAARCHYTLITTRGELDYRCACIDDDGNLYLSIDQEDLP
jgi:tetratricopeptide (TPR) repeat protein